MNRTERQQIQDEVHRLRKNGMTYKQIAMTLCVNIGVVTRTLNPQSVRESNKEYMERGMPAFEWWERSGYKIGEF